MDRRRLHRIAALVGGLVLIGGAVIVLRDPDKGDESALTPIPPARTSVAPFADKGVVVPRPGARPRPPDRLDVRPGEHRLVVGWGPRHIGAPEPDGATGYEVRWGPRESLDNVALVAEPVVQLDGLDGQTEHWVEVRTVDGFGQRSKPARARATPTARTPDPTPYTLADRFDGTPDGGAVPDPRRWRLAGVGNCAKASRNNAEDGGRMAISAQCGSSEEAVALRSRAPFRPLDPVTAGETGELGRFIVATDRPGQAGELLLDLVPGPADLVGRPPADQDGAPPTQPGRAAVDDSLPPGTIRVRISGHPAERGRRVEAGTTVQVFVAPGTPQLGRPVAVEPPPPPEIGVSVRWEVVLRTDGVRVERDGVVVGGGDVVPSWTEATALVGFAGDRGGLHAKVDLVGFTGARTDPPPLLPAPRVDFDRAVVAPDSPRAAPPSGPRVDGARSGQLRLTLLPQRRPNSPAPAPADQFTVDIGGQRIPARPAIANQPMLPGVRLPMIADVPPSTLIIDKDLDAIPIVVRSTTPEDGSLATQVLTAELELTGDPSARPTTAGRAADSPLPRPQPTLAVPTAVVFDAGGREIPAGQGVPRGGVLIEITMDGAAAQRVAGSVAGLAGVEVSLDGRALAGIPTDVDGHGVGGRWRIALDTTELAAGGHTVEVVAIGVDPVTAPAVAQARFAIS